MANQIDVAPVPDPAPFFAEVERRAQREQKYAISVSESVLEGSDERKFLFNARLDIRGFYYRYSAEGHDGSSEYLFEHGEFVCGRATDDGQVLIYCTKTGGRVDEPLRDGKDGIRTRAATPDEIAELLKTAQGMVNGLPQWALEADGTCSSSETFEPMQLGEYASFTPSSSTTISKGLCARFEKVWAAAQALRFPGVNR